MTDAGYYRGTTADQDTRFGDKTKKLMKTLKFSEVLAEPVDMRKVKLDALKPWVHEKLTEILGFEDDVVIDYAINQLEETNKPDPKVVQINLTGFLNAKNARLFMGELWPMLVSAQSNPNGIPQELIDAKKLELETHKADKETMQKFQKNIDQIQQQIKKDMDDKNERLERRAQKESRREDRSSRREDRDRKRSRRSRSGSRDRRRKEEKKRDRSRSRDRKSKSDRKRSRSRERRRERSKSPERRREKRRSRSRSPKRE